MVGHHWLKPLPVADAAALTGVTRVDERNWLVVGRHRQGHAFAARYQPLEWTLQPLSTPPGRAFLGCAGRAERNEGVAVGTDGLIVEVGNQGLKSTILEAKIDLGAVGIDTLGRKWAASTGQIWVCQPNGQWTRAHHEPGWQAPFVSVMAEVGMVCAMTADGGVLECSADTSKN
jgi:hypothetical protein